MTNAIFLTRSSPLQYFRASLRYTGQVATRDKHVVPITGTPPQLHFVSRDRQDDRLGWRTEVNVGGALHAMPWFVMHKWLWTLNFGLLQRSLSGVVKQRHGSIITRVKRSCFLIFFYKFSRRDNLNGPVFCRKMADITR